jgi:two-component system phosphate regulon response regulator PhoB
MASTMGGPGARVLVVDDDAAIRDLLTAGLSEDGYRVDTAPDVPTARTKLASTPSPELVILDILLAGDDGLGLLGDIRRTSNVPVILLTGKSRETDRIVGLKLGADDYVVKPFSLGELSARIESVLRRANPKPASPAKDFGRLVIDTATREVRVDGEVRDTTAKEFDLLAFLAASPRQVFSREQLLDHVWGSSSEWQDSATVTEHIRRIRKKIEDDPDRPRWIATVRGVGYRFEP